MAYPPATDPLRRATVFLRENRHLKYGGPLFCFLIGSVFVLREFQQVRYDYKQVKALSMSEEEKYGIAKEKGQLSKDVTLEEYKKALAEARKKAKTLEEHHEEYMKNDFEKDYKIVRGPRPWEETTNTDQPAESQIIRKSN